MGSRASEILDEHWHWPPPLKMLNGSSGFLLHSNNNEPGQKKPVRLHEMHRPWNLDPMLTGCGP